MAVARPRPRTEELAAEAHRLRSEGCSQDVIAERLGVSRSRVRALLAPGAEPVPSSPPELPPLGDVALEELQRVWLALAQRNLSMALTSAGTPRAKGWTVVAAISTDKLLELRRAITTGDDLAAVDAWLAHITMSPAKPQEEAE